MLHPFVSRGHGYTARKVHHHMRRRPAHGPNRGGKTQLAHHAGIQCPQQQHRSTLHHNRRRDSHHAGVRNWQCPRLSHRAP